MADANNGNENPENEDVLLEEFDQATDKEMDEAGDDPEKLREIIKLRTDSRQKLYARMKDAEKKAKEVPSKDKETSKRQKSDSKEVSEFDYGQEAYLIAKGIEDEESKDYLLKEMNETGKDLRAILGFKYVSEALKGIKEEKATNDAMPKDKGGRGGQSARNTVEYWIAKGELPQGEENTALRRKVVAEKTRIASTANKFGGN